MWPFEVALWPSGISATKSDPLDPIVWLTLHSQVESLKRLDGVEGRGGVFTQHLNVRLGVDQLGVKQLLQQWRILLLHLCKQRKAETRWKQAIRTLAKSRSRSHKKWPTLVASLNAYCLLSCREHSTMIWFAFADPLCDLRSRSWSSKRTWAYMETISLPSCQVWM